MPLEREIKPIPLCGKNPTAFWMTIGILITSYDIFQFSL